MGGLETIQKVSRVYYCFNHINDNQARFDMVFLFTIGPSDTDSPKVLTIFPLTPSADGSLINMRVAGQNSLVLNVGNGWVAGGCWDDYILVFSRKFPAFSTSKMKVLGKVGDLT